MLDREEYVEQAYLFKALGERMRENHTTQDLLQWIKEEILSTTRLPMAIDYLAAELKHAGAGYRYAEVGSLFHAVSNLRSK